MITTPNEISEDISKFCEEIDSTTKPVFLEFLSVDGYRYSECYGNVENHIKSNGGNVQYGWIIWEIPNVWFEAEFHAVWINNKGEYIDVTPRVNGEKTILFLPDSKRNFSGKPVKNIIKPLVNNELTEEMIKQAEINFNKEMNYYREINGIKDKKIGVNEPCPCGSGKKYKKCCIDKK